MLRNETSEDSVESVTVRLSQLEITISVRSLVPDRSVGDFELVSNISEAASFAASGAFAGSPRVGAQFGVALEEQAIQANTLAALAALPLNFLLPLQRQLRGTHAEWDSAARIGRAFRAGVLARRRLDGQLRPEVSLDLPYRNTFYIALRGKGGAPGFWTCGIAIYKSSVASRDHPSGFDPESISHAFPSRAEAAAYLAGARKEWPREA